VSLWRRAAADLPLAAASAVLAMAALWLIVAQLTGQKNSLLDRVFSIALGFVLGYVVCSVVRRR
jgi:hypothetical protein